MIGGEAICYGDATIEFEPDGPGQFKELAGVAVTPSGVIAIVDGVNSRVVLLNNRFETVGDGSDRTLSAV